MKNDKERAACADDGNNPDAKGASERERSAYFRKKYAGGRSMAARIMDYVMLRAILFFSAYLFFLPRFPARTTALLLSAIALGIAMLLLRLVREIAFERFVKREEKRIRRALLSDRLLLADPQTLLGIAGRLCPPTERAVALQRALPVNANDLLALLCAHPAHERLHVFSCTPFDRTAGEFAAHMGGRMVLHAPEELLQAAARLGLSPSREAVDAYIKAERLAARERRKRQKLRVSPFASASAKKYLLTALMLFCLSFLTRHTLYYRMLAGLCMTIAALGTIWGAGARTLSGADHIG